MSNSDLQKVMIRRNLAAAPAVVFDAWTKPQQMCKWFGPGDEFTNPILEVDLRVGGSYRIGFQACEGGGEGDVAVVGGTYLVIEPPRKLVFTWMWEKSHEFESLETLVTVELLDKDAGSELILTHEKLAGKDMAEKHTWGWNGALDRLVRSM